MKKIQERKKIGFAIAITLALSFGVAQSAFAGCTDSADNIAVLNSGVKKIQRSIHNPNVTVFTHFANADGQFRVYHVRGELHVDTPKGKFPAQICTTSTGLMANVETFFGVVTATIRGAGDNTIEVSSDGLGTLLYEPVN